MFPEHQQTRTISYRPLDWPQDRAALLTLDTSFTTDRVYRLDRTDDRFELRAITVHPAIVKSYPFAADVDAMPGYDWAQIAEVGCDLVGVAAMSMQDWNRRAILHHLYVATQARGMGVGGALLAAVIKAAGARQARCLGVETQASNYPAVQFYRKAGFLWSGLDTSLYDPDAVGADEIALFFSRELGDGHGGSDAGSTQ